MRTSINTIKHLKYWKHFGTAADFYIMNLKEYEWLGSIAAHGYPWAGKISISLLKSTNEKKFREEVRNCISKTAEIIFPNLGWPWPWPDSNSTNFTYVFYNEKVYASEFGSRWFDPTIFPNEGRKYFLWIYTPLLPFPKMTEVKTLFGGI